MDLAAVALDRAERHEARSDLIDFARESEDPKTALQLALLVRD